MVGMDRNVYAAVKKCVFSLLWKVDRHRQSVLQMLTGSEFQMLGAATMNWMHA